MMLLELVIIGQIQVSSLHKLHMQYLIFIQLVDLEEELFFFGPDPPNIPGN